MRLLAACTLLMACLNTMALDGSPAGREASHNTCARAVRELKASRELITEMMAERRHDQSSDKRFAEEASRLNAHTQSAGAGQERYYGPDLHRILSPMGPKGDDKRGEPSVDQHEMAQPNLKEDWGQTKKVNVARLLAELQKTKGENERLQKAQQNSTSTIAGLKAQLRKPEPQKVQRRAWSGGAQCGLSQGEIRLIERRLQCRKGSSVFRVVGSSFFGKNTARLALKHAFTVISAIGSFLTLSKSLLPSRECCNLVKAKVMGQPMWDSNIVAQCCGKLGPVAVGRLRQEGARCLASREHGGNHSLGTEKRTCMPLMRAYNDSADPKNANRRRTLTHRLFWYQKFIDSGIKSGHHQMHKTFTQKVRKGAYMCQPREIPGTGRYGEFPGRADARARVWADHTEYFKVSEKYIRIQKQNSKKGSEELGETQTFLYKAIKEGKSKLVKKMRTAKVNVERSAFRMADHVERSALRMADRAKTKITKRFLKAVSKKMRKLIHMVLPKNFRSAFR